MGNSRTAFRPNEDITRAELTAMAVRFFEVVGNKENFKNTGTYTVFNDVASGYWAAEYIENAALYGWVQGYGNGSFKGEAKITRAEAVTLTPMRSLLLRTPESSTALQICMLSIGLMKRLWKPPTAILLCWKMRLKPGNAKKQ